MTENFDYMMRPSRSTAAEFRARGREKLRGKWGIAILAFFLASILFASTSVAAVDLVGGLFDFNHDGETDAFEHAVGVSIVLSLGEEAETDSDDEDADDETALEALEEELDSLEDELSDLEDKLSDLEDKEPEDCTSAAYARWERRKERLEGLIAELESQISDVEDKMEDL